MWFSFNIRLSETSGVMCVCARTREHTQCFYGWYVQLWLDDHVVDAIFSTLNSSIFAEKKRNYKQRKSEYWDNKKHSHKNNNTKTLNNFEILCQQTWLESPSCHTFIANEPIVIAMRLHLSFILRFALPLNECICVHVYFYMLLHFSECVRNGRNDHTPTDSVFCITRWWTMIFVSLVCYSLITIISCQLYFSFG